MKTYIITFAPVNTDKNGDSLRNCYTIIEAENEDQARSKIFEMRGKEWAFIYPTAEAAGVNKYQLQFVSHNFL